MGRSWKQAESGVTLVEVLIAMGLVGVVSVGVGSLVSSMGKSQKNMSQKIDEMQIIQEVNMLVNDKALCGAVFDGQLATTPLAGGSKDLDHLNWGTTGKRLINKAPVNTNATAAQVVVTDLRVDVDGSTPVPLKQTDPNNANAVIDVKKFMATLTVRVEKRQTGAEKSSGAQAFNTRAIRFNILRKASDNSFIGCYSESSPTRSCEDEFGGTYDSSLHPHCGVNYLGVGTRNATGPTNLLVNGTFKTTTAQVGNDGEFSSPGTYANSGAGGWSGRPASKLSVRGNAEVNDNLYFGDDGSTFFSRWWWGRSVQQGGGGWQSTMNYDLGLFVGPRSAFRFDGNGVLQAHRGFGFNSSGLPPDPAWSQALTDGTAQYTGFLWNWNSAIPHDIGVWVNGKGRFRFNDNGIFNATQGFAFPKFDVNWDIENILNSNNFTGFFAYWEPALPNDIGVWVNGQGAFRFHEGGDFIALRDLIAGNKVTVASDERLKKNIAPLQGSLEKLQQLHGVEFQWKDPKKPQEKQIGLVAQNVETVFPELVSADHTGLKAVAYQNLVAPLIEAVKALKAYYDAFHAEYQSDRDTRKAEMEALKREVAELRAQIQALQKVRPSAAQVAQ